MIDATKVPISPQAIAELEMAVRQGLEAKLNVIERRLLMEIDQRIRLELAVQERDAKIAELRQIAIQGGLIPDDAAEGKPDAA